jgi:hypothetical protein
MNLLSMKKAQRAKKIYSNKNLGLGLILLFYSIYFKRACGLELYPYPLSFKFKIYIIFFYLMNSLT